MRQGAAISTTHLDANVQSPDSGLPADAIASLKVLVATLAHLDTVIGQFDAELTRCAK